MTETPEFLTVRELAELLRIKERKVYDMAASGDVPCSRATGRLLFPVAEIRAWIEGTKSGPRNQVVNRPCVVLGSYDPLLEWALRQSRCGLATFLDGSSDGILRFSAGEGVAAGLHIHEPGTDSWNIEHVGRACSGGDVVLLSWAVRARGLVTRPDLAERFRSLRDLVGIPVAIRQKSSGADLLFRHLLGQQGLEMDDLVTTEAQRSEQDAVLAIAEGQADVTFGLEAVARPYGLGFVPLVKERFDLLVDRRAYFEPAMQTLLDFCQSRAFSERADALSGYDIGDLGKVRWNG